MIDKNFKNNSIGIGKNGIDENASTFEINAGGDLFPMDNFEVKLEQLDENGKVIKREMLEIHSRTGNIFNILTRAYEPCPFGDDATEQIQEPQSFDAGFIVTLTASAGLFENIKENINNLETDKMDTVDFEDKWTENMENYVEDDNNTNGQNQLLKLNEFGQIPSNLTQNISVDNVVVSDVTGSGTGLCFLQDVEVTKNMINQTSNTISNKYNSGDFLNLDIFQNIEAKFNSLNLHYYGGTGISMPTSITIVDKNDEIIKTIDTFEDLGNNLYKVNLNLDYMDLSNIKGLYIYGGSPIFYLFKNNTQTKIFKEFGDGIIANNINLTFKYNAGERINIANFSIIGGNVNTPTITTEKLNLSNTFFTKNGKVFQNKILNNSDFSKNNFIFINLNTGDLIEKDGTTQINPINNNEQYIGYTDGDGHFILDIREEQSISGTLYSSSGTAASDTGTIQNNFGKMPKIYLNLKNSDDSIILSEEIYNFTKNIKYKDISITYNITFTITDFTKNIINYTINSTRSSGGTTNFKYDIILKN